MVCCGYIFDLILVRIYIPSAEIEHNHLLFVEANFNNNKLRITPSRINVVEFKPRRGFDFEISPAELRKELSSSQLKIKVFYDSQLIGVAHIPWDQKVLDKIDRNMGEIIHIDECELYSGNSEECVGCLEFVYRFQCKCEESSDEECEQLPNCDFKKCITKNIGPHDILFVVSEPKQQADCNVKLTDERPTCSSTPTEGNRNFDLKPYRYLNGETVHSTDAINLCNNLECCELRRTSDPCQCLYDVWTSGQHSKRSSSDQSQVRAPRNNKCSHKINSFLHCSIGGGNSNMRSYQKTACESLSKWRQIGNTLGRLNASKLSSNSRTLGSPQFSNYVKSLPMISQRTCLPNSASPKDIIAEFADARTVSVCNMTADEILKEFLKDE